MVNNNLSINMLINIFTYSVIYKLTYSVIYKLALTKPNLIQPG